jgi:hypothetical protein
LDSDRLVRVTRYSVSPAQGPLAKLPNIAVQYYYFFFCQFYYCPRVTMSLVSSWAGREYGSAHIDYREPTYISSYRTPNAPFQSTILHPDTMLPMDPTFHGSLKENRSQRPVELRIDGSWSLGITLFNDGVVKHIGAGTPASRARLIFESKVIAWRL